MRTVLGALVLSSMLLQSSAWSAGFRCDLTDPPLSAGKLEQCSDRVTWGYGLDAIRTKDPKKFEAAVQKQIREGTNIGSAVFRLPDGSSKTVYRGSFIPDSPACIGALVKNGGVKSVVNLYNTGDLSSHETLAMREKALFQKEGAGTYINILNYTYKFKELPKEKVFDKVAEIVGIVRAAPGNVFVHCYGGMHRTGLVFGVMQKCFNKVPVEKVIDEYRCHVAYENEQREGGRHAENEEVLRDFPCEKLGAAK